MQFRIQFNQDHWPPLIPRRKKRKTEKEKNEEEKSKAGINKSGDDDGIFVLHS